MTTIVSRPVITMKKKPKISKKIDKEKKRRIQLSADTVCLKGPEVSRHTHRKLRLLSIRNDVTLGKLVIDLIETHPRVVALESEFTAVGQQGEVT